MSGLYRNILHLFLLILIIGCQKESHDPEIGFIWPFAGARFLKGEKVNIEVDMKGTPGGVNEIQIYINDEYVTSATSFPIDYEWDTSESGVGDHVVRAVIINRQKKSSEISLPVVISSSFRDLRDNRMYRTVYAGDNIWMAENLAYLPAINPPNAGSATEKHYYVNGYRGSDLSAAKATDSYKNYGVLYNWTAAADACPKGWRLPDDNDWKALELALGMNASELDKKGPRGRGLEENFKSESGWVVNGNNSSGFSALPGGYCYIYYSAGFEEPVSVFGVNMASWWSATPAAEDAVWFRGIYGHEKGIIRSSENKINGLSVRCIKE